MGIPSDVIPMVMRRDEGGRAARARTGRPRGLRGIADAGWIPGGIDCYALAGGGASNHVLKVHHILGESKQLRLTRVARPICACHVSLLWTQAPI